MNTQRVSQEESFSSLPMFSHQSWQLVFVPTCRSQRERDPRGPRGLNVFVDERVP
jgi:hypothetical protein